MALQQLLRACDDFDSGLFVRRGSAQSHQSQFSVTFCAGVGRSCLCTYSVQVKASFSFSRASFHARSFIFVENPSDWMSRMASVSAKIY